MSARLLVDSFGGTTSIYLTYDATGYERDMLQLGIDHDSLHVGRDGRASFNSVRMVNNKERRTVLFATVDRSGTFTWTGGRMNNRPLSKFRAAQQVEKHGDAIDYLLERYEARMDSGTYTVKGPPRKNPSGGVAAVARLFIERRAYATSVIVSYSGTANMYEDDYDELRVGNGADGRIYFDRQRRGRMTSMTGSLSPQGDVSWEQVWQSNGTVTQNPSVVRRYVANSSNAIDYLLEKHFARMASGIYVEKDPPRKNPARRGQRLASLCTGGL